MVFNSQVGAFTIPHWAYVGIQTRFKPKPSLTSIHCDQRQGVVYSWEIHWFNQAPTRNEWVTSRIYIKHDLNYTPGFEPATGKRRIRRPNNWVKPADWNKNEPNVIIYFWFNSNSLMYYPIRLALIPNYDHIEEAKVVFNSQVGALLLFNGLMSGYRPDSSLSWV